MTMTPLDKTIKRSLAIKGVDYVVTLTPDALKLTRKGKRLHASVGRFDAPTVRRRRIGRLREPAL
jgi:hypothetical protein